MRLANSVGLIVVGLLAFASPARADAINYTFTGTLSFGSFLDNGDGVQIDLSGAAFTATGITGDLLLPASWGVWQATTTYDFGALGSFTTNDWADRYVQDPTRSMVGLLSWFPGSIDQIGFMVTVPATVNLDSTQPSILDTAAIATYTERREQHNAAGQVFLMNGFPSLSQPQVEIATVTTEPVPEPGTLSLLIPAAVALLRRPYKRRSTNRR